MRNPAQHEAGFGVMSAAMAAALLTAMAVGCGSKPQSLQIPVSGKVTIDGKPATEGGVSYRDEQTGMNQPAGKIAADGTYTLTHAHRDGAPPGRYRVVVFVTESPKSATGEIIGLPKVVVNNKFTNPATTPLTVEVTQDGPPGQYDLAVTR